MRLVEYLPATRFGADWRVLALAVMTATGGLAVVSRPLVAQVPLPPASVAADEDDPFAEGVPPVLPSPYFLDPAASNRATQLEALLGQQDAQPGENGQPPDGKPLTEEQKQAARLLQQHVRVEQLPRSPGHVLRALADRAAPKPEAEKPPKGEVSPDAAKAQRFYRQVVTGDWKAVKDYLAELPKDVGPKVYNHLLGLLLQGVVLPDEIPLLADASPSDLDRQQLAVLGQLLRQSLRHVGEPSAMLAAIAAGSEQLGGNDPRRRLAAARLLIAAGMIAEAGPYLPALEEVLRNKDPEVINLHALYLQALSVDKSDQEARRRAWDLTQTVLYMPAVDEAPRSEAFARTFALMPLMPQEAVSTWLRKLFTEQPVLAMRLLAQVAQHVESSFARKSFEPRVQALKTQRQVVSELLAAAGQQSDSWSTALEMMMLGWLNEAQYTVAARQRGSGSPPAGASSAHLQSVAQMIASHTSRKIQPLPAESLFPLCPEESWCRAVPADLARQVRRLNGKLAAIVGDREQTFAAIRHFAGSDPDFAKQLAEQYVGVWVGQLGGGSHGNYDFSAPSPAHFASPYMSIPSGYFGGGRSGIPLTRAKQVRNLAAFADLLEAIEALDVPPLEEDVLVGSFDACHSPAEVYREEDLQKVFGELEDLRPEITLRLAATIRAKLAGQWRMPEVQEQMNTRRTDKEHVAEVTRGYALALRLVTGAAKRLPRKVEFPVLLAAVYFDQAEFFYGQKVDLKTYTVLRDRAFGTYREAALIYARSLPQLPPEGQSAGVFQQWFQSALGASDLAYLTRQDRPDRDQIEEIAAAIHDLGDEAADRHLAMFGQAIAGSMGAVPPQLKPHYLREALRVLGDHPGGEKARQQLQFYDELLGEIQLHLAVDGRAEVGCGQPFGVHLSIRSTNALGRESGGFTYLLQKSYSQSTGREIDHKERLEEVIREKLSESFEIESIQFHDPKVTPRGFGRRGWRETPLAYLVARCKDPSVDRIPVVHVDLEFNDGSGVVLLPVISQVVLIDSRDADPDPRPVSELQLKQVLDDRRLSEGSVRLEVAATAKGLIPDLDRLLDVGHEAVRGFTIRKVEDLGLELSSLDASGDEVRPVCQRRWLLDLEPTEGATVGEFTFPEAKDSSIALEYQRYEDADIVDTAAVVPLRTFVLAERTWLWLGCGLAALLLLCFAAVMAYRYRRRRSEKVGGPVYRRPDPLTPFNLLVLLRRIHGDHTLDLPAGERRHLAETIDDLELRFFQAGSEAADSPDLTAVLDRWLAQTVDGRKPVRQVS